MTGAATVVQRLFGPPGGSGTDPAQLLKQAAAAHAALLSRAAEKAGRCRDPSLAPVILFLQGPASLWEKRRLLCHPLFVEGLHGLAQFYPELGRWHERV